MFKPSVIEPERREHHLPEGVSRAYLLFHRVCPLGFTDAGSLRVAVTEGSQRSALDELSLAYRVAVEPIQTAPDLVDLEIDRLTGEAEELALARVDDLDEGFTPDIEDQANQAPVIRYVNHLVREAHEAGASDIHLEQARSAVDARMRVDGRLVQAAEAPSGLGPAVVSRIKLLAQLDIAERRQAQDGRIRVRTAAGELDLRVSTVPTLHGESVVLRLLERGRGPTGLEELGMPEGILGQFHEAVTRPRGFVLVTGPTGSGKTTTLYSALRLRELGVEKILTVEDPVEYELDRVSQVPVREASGVTFASALRSLLRQDPDVMLVGEMRDRETAEVAIQSALTGHFVLSTLHTNDALGAIPRLKNLGVPPYLLAATIDGILAQRLVRRICDSCREAHQPEVATLRALASQLQPAGPGSPRVRRLRGPFYRGNGCNRCRGSGYRGRTGLFEWLPITANLREAVVADASRGALLDHLDAGFQTMSADGLGKVRSGATTVEEVLGAVATL